MSEKIAALAPIVSAISETIGQSECGSSPDGAPGVAKIVEDHAAAYGVASR